MKKYDVLVIGELNVDLILNNIRDFPKIGTEIIADDMELTIGSSSAIFACNLSVLGPAVAFLGIIGDDDFGNLVVNTFDQKKVSTEFVIRNKKYKTGATIALNYGEDRAMVTHPGAMEHLTDIEITPAILQQCRHVHISSVFLQPGILQNLAEILRLAKSSGLTTSLDTQWDPQEKWNIDLKEILPLTDIFFPNIQELKALTGTGEVDTAIDTVKRYAHTIAVKMGNQGSIGFSNGEKIMAGPFLNHEPVDAIGAGDSFNAGFVFKYLQKASLEQCLTFGNLAGAINTTAPGGTTAFGNFENVKKTALERFKFRID